MLLHSSCVCKSHHPAFHNNLCEIACPLVICGREEGGRFHQILQTCQLVLCRGPAEVFAGEADGGAHFQQPVIDTGIAVVDALPICDLLLGQPAHVVGTDAAGLSGGGVGKGLPQGSGQPVTLGLFLGQHNKLLRGRAVFQSVVLRPVVGIQRVVGPVILLAALMVPHFPDGLAQHVKDFLADLYQLVLLTVGVMEP